MRTFVGIACALLATLAAAASPDTSVVIGHGVSNAFLSKLPCAPGSVCLDSRYLWIIDATQTAVGPTIVGTVRAVAEQHVDAAPEFVKAVELFVLRPISDVALRETSGAEFQVVALSARDPQGRYCLPVAPGDVGINLPPSEVVTAGGSYCFSASALASNNRLRGP
jgi:hypothetical protein